MTITNELVKDRFFCTRAASGNMSAGLTDAWRTGREETFPARLLEGARCEKGNKQFSTKMVWYYFYDT